MCIIFGCMFVLSCGNKLSEQELKNLEIQAEKGDVEAAIKLRDYYDNMPIGMSHKEYCELKEKAEHGDVDAQRKIEGYEKKDKDYKRALILAAENGDLESAYVAAIVCSFDFAKGINIIENKKNYRKFMEITIAKGYKEKKDGFGIGNIAEYKHYYQNQSDEWWDSDSIKTKEQLSEK